MKNILRALLDSLWLPLLIVLGTSWLYAPWLNGDRIGHLQLISVYEGSAAPYDWLFRFGDVLAAALIWICVWRSGLWQRQRWLAGLLVGIGLLSMIDTIFVIGCIHHCSAWADASVRIHDIESTISVFVIAAAAAIDAFKNKQRISQVYLALQLTIAVVLLTALLSKQAQATVQYVYQASTIAWIGLILYRRMPSPRYRLNADFVRRILAVLLFSAAVLEIVNALHGHLHGDIPTWIAQYGVISGTLLLYLIRQILNGQRRAAGLVAVLVATLVIKYSLITPRPLALVTAQLVLVGIWLGWDSFGRNVGTPPIVSRLKNVWLVLIGVVVAIGLTVSIGTLTGRQDELLRQSKLLFGTARTSQPARRAERGEDRLEREARHFRLVSLSLLVTIGVLTVWTVFRPAAGFKDDQRLSSEEIDRLLDRFGASSEDYFKRWPSGKQYFRVPDIDGFIAYKKVNHTMFCLADPICAPQQRAELLRRFTEDCRRHGWTVGFFIVAPDSTELYKAAGYKLFPIGASAVISIDGFTETTMRDKWWRWQLNRAKKAGLSYGQSRPPHSQAVLRETKVVSDRWLERAGHKEQGFALGYYDIDYLQQCTLHLLRAADGQLVAFANQLPTYHQNRQATVDLIRFLPDANGAMPVLVAQLIDNLKNGPFETFDLGYVPFAKVDTTIAQVAKKLAAGRFSAAGLEQFKGKFKPEWQPQYLALDGDLVDVTVFLARLEKALTV